MKKYIYTVALLGSLGIASLFAGEKKDKRQLIIDLIEQQIQKNHDGKTALKCILQKAPRKHIIDPGWKKIFIFAYPQWQELYTKSPTEFRKLFE